MITSRKPEWNCIKFEIYKIRDVGDHSSSDNIIRLLLRWLGFAESDGTGEADMMGEAAGTGEDDGGGDDWRRFASGLGRGRGTGAARSMSMTSASLPSEWSDSTFTFGSAFLRRFFVPIAFIVGGRLPALVAAANSAFSRWAFSFSRNASMPPYSSSLSSINCADLYCSFSFIFFSFFFRWGSSPDNTASSSETDGDRRLLRRRFLLMSWEAFFPSRSIGSSKNCLMTLWIRCNSKMAVPEGTYHSNSSAS